MLCINSKAVGSTQPLRPRKWRRRNGRHDARPQPISLTFLPLRALGLNVPLSLIGRVDDVIQYIQ
jgi:hypothetical protein